MGSLGLLGLQFIARDLAAASARVSSPTCNLVYDAAGPGPERR